MSLKLFDQLVTQYLDEYGNLITDNTTASAGMAATGGQGGAVGEARARASAVLDRLGG